ncbi:MAG: glycosyltransferase family 39 protein [Bryobacteraceae bacterium]|nr:glycosyltransferase family 39 protein [Bryobacteraceae bacterium]
MTRFLLCFAAALAILWLKVTLGSVGAAYVDPIGRIRAQDEAVYSHTAIRMADAGDWLTPRFMDRFALYKPPLFYWLTAAIVKLGGVSVLTLRLGSMLAAAAMVALLAWRARTLPVSLALLTLAGNEYLARLSGLALTDVLLTALIVLALDLLRQDETLALRRTALAFGVLTGLALLTKGIAGLLPLIALGAHQAIRLFRRQPLAPWSALLMIFGVAIAVAAPWHIYQWIVHPRWFLAEYVGVEILRYGLGAPPQTSTESTALFYAGRFFRLEPALFVLGALALFRAKSNVAWALGLTVVAAVFGYQYRNVSYWLPLIPAFAMAIGEVLDRHPKLAWVAPIAFLSLFTPGGLRRSADPPLAMAAELHAYCAERRANDLYILGTPDEFHATLLPLAGRVRYVFIAPPPEYGSESLDFHALGITRTVEEELSGTPPREDVLAWGLPDRRSLGTVILARDNAEVEHLMAARPSADFFLAKAHRAVRIAGEQAKRACAL